MFVERGGRYSQLYSQPSRIEQRANLLTADILKDSPALSLLKGINGSALYEAARRSRLAGQCLSILFVHQVTGRIAGCRGGVVPISVDHF